MYFGRTIEAFDETLLLGKSSLRRGEGKSLFPKFCNSPEFAEKRALPGRYRVRPSRKRESDMGAPLELTLLDEKTTHNLISRMALAAVPVQNRG